MGVLKHGESNTRLYHVWAQMHQRCNNPKQNGYEYYGGRGISVCREWHDFAAFRAWAMKTGYDENAPRGQCTIDRIDSNGDYTPDNCRWTTIEVQLRNRRQRERRPTKAEMKRLKLQEEEARIDDLIYTHFFGSDCRDTRLI